MSESIKGFFYPELCEKKFDELRVHKGRLPLEGAIPISGEEQFEGGFGDTYLVSWFLPGLKAAAFSRDAEDKAIKNSLCCLKVLQNVYRTKKSTNFEQYAKHCCIEYELLRKADGASGRVPRPFAFGTVNIKIETEDKSESKENVLWAICMEYLPTRDGSRYFLSDQTSILNQIKNLRNRFYGFAAGNCTPRELASLAYQMCLALKDLHGKGVTHRDLQPRNVAVSFDTNMDGDKIVDRVFFIDLGNSVLVENDVTPVDKGIRLARAAYGAPEVFAFEVVTETDGARVYERRVKHRYYDLRNEPTADIWSFGAIVYFYFTGHNPPFKSDGSDESHYKLRAASKKTGLRLLGQHEGDGEDSPNETLKVLDEIVRGCTQYDPSNRLSLGEIQRKLEKILGTYIDLDFLTSKPLQTVRVGEWVLSIPQRYIRVHNNLFFHEYSCQVDEITYTVMVSCDSELQSCDWGNYISEVEKQIHRLYGKGANVREEQHTIEDLQTRCDRHVHCFEISEAIDSNSLFMSKNYLCCVEDMAIRVGTACQVLNDAKLLSKVCARMNCELDEAIRSLKQG